MPDIGLGNTVVPISTVAKNIGIFFDDALSMTNHVQHICRVAYFHFIGRILNILDRKTTESMVRTCMTSHLDNGHCMLYGISVHLLTRLQRVRNVASRLITIMKKHDHITAILIDLHWLPIEQRIEYKLLLLTFRSLHGLVASYLTDLLIRHQPTACYAPRTLTCYRFFHDANYVYAGRTNIFNCCSTRLWNNLPLAIRAQTASVRSKSNIRHFCLKERFHFKRTFIISEHF